MKSPDCPEASFRRSLVPLPGIAGSCGDLTATLYTGDRLDAEDQRPFPSCAH